MVTKWVIEEVVGEPTTVDLEVHALALFGDRRMSPSDLERAVDSLEAELRRGHDMQEKYERDLAINKQMSRWEAIQDRLDQGAQL